MPLINIPFGTDFNANLIEFLKDENFNQNYPNLGKIFIITPSRETAQNLKLSFAKHSVIMPKITSITEIADKLPFKECSPLQIKLYLYEIAKKYLKELNSASIFSYIDDFLELEKLINQNRTDLASSLEFSHHFIENMALHLQKSLIQFLKMYAEWQKFKDKNKLKTQEDINTLAFESLQSHQFEKHDAVIMVYFQGTSHLQIELARKILSLKNGYVFLNGGEQKGINANLIKNFINQLKEDFINLKASKENINYYYKNFQNLTLLSNQAVLKAISLLNQNEKIKIAFICYDIMAGRLISSQFSAFNMQTSTVFTESLEENYFFNLFLHQFQDKTENYLTFTKSPHIIFEKEAILKFEKSLRDGKNGASKPFDFQCKNSHSSFNDFLETTTKYFENYIEQTSLKSEKFKQFKNFICKILEDTKNIQFIESEKTYISLLKNLVKMEKIAQKDSENIFILSPIEARARKFDHIFIINANEGSLPKPSSSNKILNHYLQKMLKIDEKKDDVEWLDFSQFLMNASSIYCFSARQNFEEKSENRPSPFFLHALTEVEFMPYKEEFYNLKEVNIPPLNPPFKIEYISKLSPTSLETLLSNPFDYYVNNILKARNLGEIRDEISSMSLGNLIHDAIEKFYKNDESIYENCKYYLEKNNYRYEFLLYEEAILELQSFFIEEKNNQKAIKTIMEEKISHIQKFENEKILLEAKPDAIFFYQDSVEIIDYKVYSKEITKTDVRAGRKPQLPFQAFIIAENMPHLAEKISLFYYFINLKKPRGEVVKKTLIPFDDFTIVKNSIQELTSKLKFFIYKEEESSFCKHLARKL